jgi:2,3-bisphosphoglycerate-dependent phosphoglycerate mutase
MRRIWCGLACSLIVACLFQLRHSPATAQDKSGPSMVWLVRHAEKDTKPKGDEKLLPQGHKRAEDLRTCLGGKGLTAIIISDKQRTRQTADKIAELQGITPVVVPVVESTIGIEQNIEAVAAKVRTTPGNVLVVGHSHTVSGIVEKLGGPAGLGNLTVFHRLFALDLSKGKAAFEELKYGAAPKNSKKKQCEALALVRPNAYIAGAGLRGALETYSRGLTILKGAVPDRARGPGHMAPTYFCRFPGSNSDGFCGSALLP